MQKIPWIGDRVQTGPMQLGDDWPGVFIRGDEAEDFRIAIQHMRKQIGDVGDTSTFFEMEQLLASCRVK